MSSFRRAVSLIVNRGDRASGGRIEKRRDVSPDIAGQPTSSGESSLHMAPQNYSQAGLNQKTLSKLRYAIGEWFTIRCRKALHRWGIT
jgi:hypothetical protein